MHPLSALARSRQSPVAVRGTSLVTFRRFGKRRKTRKRTGAAVQRQRQGEREGEIKKKPAAEIEIGVKITRARAPVDSARVACLCLRHFNFHDGHGGRERRGRGGDRGCITLQFPPSRKKKSLSRAESKSSSSSSSGGSSPRSTFLSFRGRKYGSPPPPSRADRREERFHSRVDDSRRPRRPRRPAATIDRISIGRSSAIKPATIPAAPARKNAVAERVARLLSSKSKRSLSL